VNKFENLVILEWHPITEPRAVAIGCKHSTNLITSLPKIALDSSKLRESWPIFIRCCEL
jgi:hypothetical protein